MSTAAGASVAVISRATGTPLFADMQQGAPVLLKMQYKTHLGMPSHASCIAMAQSRFGAVRTRAVSVFGDKRPRTRSTMARASLKAPPVPEAGRRVERAGACRGVVRPAGLSCHGDKVSCTAPRVGAAIAFDHDLCALQGIESS